MLQYIIRRLLLIFPTFFAISIIIFLVLNIAPGRPGETNQEQGQKADAQIQNESYRIFKEQFALDKPILFNTRFTLDRGEVREWIVDAHNLHGETSSKARIHAQEDLEDFGNRLVEHLIVLLEKDEDPTMRRLAALHLTQAAQQRYQNERRGDPKKARAQNQEIRQANDKIRGWSWEDGADQSEIDEVTASWLTWWEEHKDRFTYSGWENFSAFFLDTRFATYWGNLVRFDFGVSTVDRRPVMPTIMGKLKYSLSLTLVAILLAYLIAVPIGIYSAVRQGTAADATITVILFVLYSLPTFFTGTVLLKLLSEGDPWALFPTGNYETLDAGPQTTLAHAKDVIWHLILPIATYTSVALAALSRYARAGIIDVIRADYIRTARAKGLSEPVVILKHAARNGMIPILTLLGGLLPILVSGSVVIEVVFNIPGMGLYLFDAINLRDYNAVMGVLLISSLLTLFGILLSDISYSLADPRISLD